jgi:glycosyltransferase involved in cell wall biosynthesis
MIALPGDACNRAAAGSPAVDAPLENPGQDIESLLRPFLEQSAPARSIVAVGCPPIVAGNQAALLRLVVDEHGCPAIVAREPIRPAGRSRGGEHAYTLDGLARHACELSGPVAGHDLLVLPVHALNAMMTPLAGDFGFRAVAALVPQAPGGLSDGGAWKLRRSLFDRGLVCIGSVPVAGCQALCFLASDAVRSVRQLEVESRGHIAISILPEGARFANQLFRYSYVKLYALRHGLTAAFPEWEGQRLFGLDDKSCEGLALQRLSFPGFSDEDLELWKRDDPPIDIDLVGYFQELPECWRRHRPLLRRLFQLPPEQLDAIDAWRHGVTDGGRRTLVAIHVRRGDYRILQREDQPWFRIVPEVWYLDWLRNIWPALREPLLFVATDEPDAILPVFQEFETIAGPSGSIAQALPDYVRDFEILRRADYLAICNSSFSRMAAILAPSTQKCFLPSFETHGFESYEPWMDKAFWARFVDSWRHTDLRNIRQGRPALTVSGRNAVDAPGEPATIFFDLSDLLLYLVDHTTLSGIQRVQCEILRNLRDIPHPLPVRFVVLNQCEGIGTIETSALLAIVEDIRNHTASRAEIRSKLRALLSSVVPCALRSRDVFLIVGAFWNVKGMGLVLQELKNSGVIIGVFIHDILPITASEYFEAHAARVFVKGVIEALTFADFILTSSEYNKASLIEHLASRNLDPLPIQLVPLGHELSLSAPIESKISSVVAGILDTDYVLCVGTIEARKNPAYLFNIWKMMVSSGRPDIPYLVFAGRKGWLVQDVMDQMKACNYLGRRIVVAHNVTDVELDWLYRKCMLTVFPSLVEGWGLPVGESLAHGKICLCSDMGGIREVGGDLGDYIDPYNACDGLEQLLRYLDDPELRRSREREIAGHFEPRSWRKTTDGLLGSIQALAPLIRPFEGVAAIVLPPDRYLPLGSDATAIEMDPMDGKLSAELICISGWHPPETSGVRAAQPATMIRFRAGAAVGTRINLVLRLAAYGCGVRIRIRSGSEAETAVCVADGSERLAVLSCEVEPGKLVTAHLSLADTAVDGAAYWMLQGILYFDPKRLAGEALNRLRRGHGPRSPATGPSPPLTVEQLDRREHASHRDRILLRSAAMDDGRRAASLGAFLQTADSYWPSSFTSDRHEPIFADPADRLAFHSFCGNSDHAAQAGRIDDRIKLIRRSDQFVSMTRFSEGSVFDRSGVWRALGYLQVSPPAMAPWFLKEADGVWVAEEALAMAPGYDQSCLIFYNGNLHNYFHWLVEGLLTLDILSRALGPGSNLTIPLPKSMDINAVFDHRETLRAVGLGGPAVVEVAANLIKVREAIWVDSDQVQSMPAPYLKTFQRRIAALYADRRGPRNRRLLVARKGPTRTIHNLEQVQAFLSRYHFETVYLEGMSFVDQILLFQSAEFIVSPHGAGLANLLFCEPGTKVIELMPSVEMRPFFWLISEKLDLVHGLQFCATVGRQGFQAAISVDIGKLQALIRLLDGTSKPL